jgi:hypothetical protein
VLSNAVHLSSGTGRAIVCTFVPGQLTDEDMPIRIAVDRPPGTLLPELIQFLPQSALGEPIDVMDTAVLREAVLTVAALISC